MQIRGNCPVGGLQREWTDLKANRFTFSLSKRPQRYCSVSRLSPPFLQGIPTGLLGSLRKSTSSFFFPGMPTALKQARWSNALVRSQLVTYSNFTNPFQVDKMIHCGGVHMNIPQICEKVTKGRCAGTSYRTFKCLLQCRADHLAWGVLSCRDRFQIGTGRMYFIESVFSSWSRGGTGLILRRDTLLFCLYCVASRWRLFSQMCKVADSSLSRTMLEAGVSYPEDK